MPTKSRDIWDGEFAVDGLLDSDSEEATVSGWSTIYDQVFTKWSYRDYEFRRVLVKDAFKESLDAGADVYLAVNHDFNRAFARTGAGTLQVESRDRGLFFQARVSKRNPDALAMLVEMDRGTLREASSGYDIIEQEIESTTTSDGKTVDTQVITVADINLGDVSVCLYGSNRNASARILPSDSALRVADMYPDWAEENGIDVSVNSGRGYTYPAGLVRAELALLEYQLST